MRNQFRLSVAAALLLGTPAQTFAASVTVEQTFHFLDNRSANSINLAAGVFKSFGANNVTPNGGAGTSGTASQGALTNRPLNWTPVDVSPNRFVGAVASSGFNGAWTLTFANGPDVTAASTPNTVGATLIDFARNMQISGSGNAPTFSWSLPSQTTIDTQRVLIRDTTELLGSGGVGGAGVANIVFSKDIGANATTFTVNPADPNFTQALIPGRLYSLELELRDLRNPAGGVGLPNTLSMSRSFFDFTLLADSAPANVFLPTINTAVPGAGPVYQFSIDVKANQRTFIDPIVAVGYDYQVGAGNPLFASVTLPTGIGDNLYQLFVWNGVEWVFSTDLTGGTEYSFGSAGLDRFRILGIELSANLDPNNSLAFITGLTFLSDGEFTGTMTPITAETPIPATLALFGSAVFGGGWLLRIRTRKRKSETPPSD
jgi:hypothetical protein